MDKRAFFLYYDKPCKFRLRSGKEVYGVIWKDQSSDGSEHFFASSEDYHLIKHSKNRQTPTNMESLKLPVNIDDVIAVEMLEGLVPGKDMFK